MTIFEELRLDHDKQRHLLDKLMQTSGDEEERKEGFIQLKRQLEQHAVAEERFFYKPLIDHDSTVELSRHGMAEHHEIDELVEELEATDMSSSAWIAILKKLDHKVRHHLEDEEQGFFQQAGKVLAERDKTHLAKEYRQSMENEGI
ncbi:hemerythrin domain-containing protein [Aliidiomarina soli]|uniref:Hemerythrin n=1 Tax=Aliidiomarina soli TaxID=1928574 RepID=A0A432WH92_9GAMM|nr:hemerythrin domain-containing protein [Aliidiomarina soli]RUO33196.1 hemerythrin [Aliidiomarina soli]